MDSKEKKTIEKVVSEFVKTLEIDGTFEIAGDEDTINIIFDTKDSGLVIGYHGDTLESLQLLLPFCIAKKLGRFIRVSIEVGDYKKKRTEWLKNLALSTKERAVAENRQIVLPELKSWERRVIHLLLQDDKEVTSGSQGEGRDRVLVVSPKQ